jgi:hypothetical protein
MTQTKRPSKAKRKLSDIDFEHEGAHIALVSKDQDGPANGHDYVLVMKATKLSDEFIEKVQKIRVTMELPEFLNKFFNLYYEDAELLARLLGYQDDPEAPQDEYFQDWIAQKLKAFEIVKALGEADNIADVLSELEEEQYLNLLKDQELLEKAFAKMQKSKPVKTSSLEETKGKSVSTENASVEKSVEPIGSKQQTKEEGTNMQHENVEMVAKAELELIQKAFEEQKQALEKAQAIIAQYEQEKKEAIAKARKAELQAVVKNEAKTEILFKALGKVEDEAEFKEIVKTLGEMLASVEKSALFQEQGVQSDEEAGVGESAVAKILKSRLNK